MFYCFRKGTILFVSAKVQIIADNTSNFVANKLSPAVHGHWGLGLFTRRLSSLFVVFSVVQV